MKILMCFEVQVWTQPVTSGEGSGAAVEASCLSRLDYHTVRRRVEGRGNLNLDLGIWGFGDLGIGDLGIFILYRE